MTKEAVVSFFCIILVHFSSFLQPSDNVTGRFPLRLFHKSETGDMKKEMKSLAFCGRPKMDLSTKRVPVYLSLFCKSPTIPRIAGVHGSSGHQYCGKRWRGRPDCGHSTRISTIRLFLFFGTDYGTNSTVLLSHFCWNRDPDSTKFSFGRTSHSSRRNPSHCATISSASRHTYR